MLRKATAMFVLAGAFVALLTAAVPAAPSGKTVTAAPCFSCSFMQTEPYLALTGNPSGSYTDTLINFAAHYFTFNPYSQAQWETGISLGTISGCSISSRVRGQKVQYDGRVMECTISTSGNVVIRWISGPAMPSSGLGSPAYVVSFSNVAMSTY